MTKKRKSIFKKTMFNLIFLIPTFISLFGKIVTLIGMEARLVAKNLKYLSVYLVIILILSGGLWLSILALIFSLLTLNLHLGMQWSLSILVFLNLFLILIVGLLLMKLKGKLFFPITRKQILNVKISKQDDLF